MARRSNADLVTNAEKKRPRRLQEAVFLDSGLGMESLELFSHYSPWVRALNDANLHITVPKEEVERASSAYQDISSRLVRRLSWPADSIKILPQGSSSTQTLIRSPNGGEKFDIDAVCQVDISRIEANDPVAFFEEVGKALKDLDAEAKKRCWRIPFTNQSFYLEFTPSVPLESVSSTAYGSLNIKYSSADIYKKTALAVVDNPTKRWKTSNPEGFTSWVADAANIRLVLSPVLESAAIDKKASIEPVPEQEVDITDTLRIAIRLFKRHRDICARRKLIDAETQPISVIIVTLLTSCYRGLADLNRTYRHPIQILVDLAELLPGMIDLQPDGYHVDNPTVDGENFAERWNEDGGTRAATFNNWCDLLMADLRAILMAKSEMDIRQRVEEAFGIVTSGGTPSGSGTPGLAPARRRPVQPVPQVPGLA